MGILGGKDTPKRDRALYEAVTKVVDEGRAFVMLSKNEAGNWELASWLPEGVHDFEAVGALYNVIHNDFLSEYE